MSLINVIGLALQVYSVVVIARLILSWFDIAATGTLATIYGWIYAATEPPLRAIRSVVPPVRMGAGALDLSPIILLAGLWLLGALLGV
jgi:YggT family protein